MQLFSGNLDKHTKGRIAELIAKAHFLSWGFEVYEPEVDNRGADFIARRTNTDSTYWVQVKSTTKSNRANIVINSFKQLNKDKFYIYYVRFNKQDDEGLFLIPVTAWKKENRALVIRNYKSKKTKSAPELGINDSNKNYHLLEQYRASKVLNHME